MKIIICAETRSSQVDRISLELLAAARSLSREGDEVAAMVATDSIESVAPHLGAADRVIAAVDTGLASPTAEAYVRVADSIVGNYEPDLVLIAYSAVGLDVAGSLAHRRNIPLVAYVTRVERNDSSIRAVGQLYGGKVQANVEIVGPAVLLINPGAFEEAASAPANPASILIHDLGSSLNGLKVQLIGEETVGATDSEADILDKAVSIISVGRGIGDETGVAKAVELAKLLGAEIAGSRPVVDIGLLPKHRQVGKTGRKVKPKLYLALGVSGAPEHLEGMARSDLIIAVNTDTKAPIFGVAHYGATCDLFNFVAALTDRLKG